MIKEMSTASGLWALIEDEGEANKGYASFLALYGERLSEEHKQAIEHIMAEEHKHACTLMDMAVELTGIKPDEN